MEYLVALVRIDFMQIPLKSTQTNSFASNFAGLARTWNALLLLSVLGSSVCGYVQRGVCCLEFFITDDVRSKITGTTVRCIHLRISYFHPIVGNF